MLMYVYFIGPRYPLMGNLYKEQESVVRTTSGDSDWFKIERGVRQGCVVSPRLYNIFIHHGVRAGGTP